MFKSFGNEASFKKINSVENDLYSFQNYILNMPAEQWGFTDRVCEYNVIMKSFTAATITDSERLMTVTEEPQKQHTESVY